jgi:hypothetical protein
VSRPDTPKTKNSYERPDFSFDLNVKAMYRLIKLTLPAMLENGGWSI